MQTLQPTLITLYYMQLEKRLSKQSSACIHRALNSDVRSYSDVSYLPGDKLYYHRQGALEWRGPATVLGKDGQIVLLKHGGYYICVRPCRLTLVPKSGMEVSSSSSALDTVPSQPLPPLKSLPVYDDDQVQQQPTTIDLPEQQLDQAPTSSPVVEVQTPLILGIHAPVTNETPPPVGRTGPISETPPLSVDRTNSISETPVVVVSI